MKLGFLTACLPDLELAAIAEWAAGAGYEALEVAAWPAVGDRQFTVGHLDVRGFDEQPPRMAVAGLGDAALASLLVAGVFAADEPKVSH